MFKGQCRLSDRASHHIPTFIVLCNPGILLNVKLCSVVGFELFHFCYVILHL